MNKDETIKDIQNIINANCWTISEHFASNVANALYNAGYRKVPVDSVVLSREEHEMLVKTAQGKIGNMKATEFLKACISSGVMVKAVSTKEQVKQAVKEFAEEIKPYIKGLAVGMDGEMLYVLDETIDKIDELLKEYEK